jgi:glutaconate CoA-transferase, subunit A
MNANIFQSVPDLVDTIRDGVKLAIPKESSGAAMAATRELLRRGVRNLHLVCVPVGGMQADVLIGAGCVATLETSAVSLGEYGPAPRFGDAVRTGKIKVLDSTCPAIYAGLQAAEKGLPFMPLRGIIGSDLFLRRDDWRVIDNPFQSDDKIVALAAIKPDIALFHAPYADRFGNVFIGRDRELMTLAHASQSTLVTAEVIVEHDLLAEVTTASGTIPALYISAIAHAKGGAAPYKFHEYYGDEEATLANYAAAANTQAGFDRFVANWINAAQRQISVAV